MNEVDFSGWVNSKENAHRIKTDFWYRWGIHKNRAIKAIKYRRWWYFNWWNIKGLLFNQKQQF